MFQSLRSIDTHFTASSWQQSHKTEVMLKQNNERDKAAILSTFQPSFVGGLMVMKSTEPFKDVVATAGWDKDATV